MTSNYPQGYTALFLNHSLGNFCFYGLRSLLVLYLTSVFLFSDQRAFDLYGTFMALTYLTPVLGGWLSDNILGTRLSILIGGSLVFVGCLFFVEPQIAWLILGLTFVSLGMGFMKPSTLSAVGRLFSQTRDAEKDGAYTTLYIGMNVGSTLGPLVCGWLGHVYGWHFVFPVIGGSVLLASMYCFVKLKPIHSIATPASEIQISRLTSAASVLGIGSIVWFCLAYADYMDLLMPIIILGSLSCLGFLYKKSGVADRKKLMQIGALMILFALFCSVFEQAGSSLTLFIDRCVDRQLWSFQIPTEFFQSLNPVLVIILGALLSRLGGQGKRFGVFEKFLIGFLFVGASFLLLGFIPRFANGALVSPLWIVLVFAIQVIGELYIVPIGFSAVSKLSPQKYTSFVMGLWLVSIACGHYIASLLAKFSSLSRASDLSQSLGEYQSFFMVISIIPFALVCLIGIYIVALKRRRTLNFDS